MSLLATHEVQLKYFALVKRIKDLILHKNSDIISEINVTIIVPLKITIAPQSFMFLRAISKGNVAMFDC